MLAGVHCALTIPLWIRLGRARRACCAPAAVATNATQALPPCGSSGRRSSSLHSTTNTTGPSSHSANSSASSMCISLVPTAQHAMPTDYYNKAADPASAYVCVCVLLQTQPLFAHAEAMQLKAHLKCVLQMMQMHSLL